MLDAAKSSIAVTSLQVWPNLHLAVRRQRQEFLLKTLHCVKRILNEEECRSVGKSGLWWDELAVALAVKPPGVVQETVGVLEVYKGQMWCGITARRIRMLSELYQDNLVTEDEVKWMKGEGGYLSSKLVIVQCTKPTEVVTKTTVLFYKFRHNEEARQLRALNELFTRHLLTADECSEVARKAWWEWEDHLAQILSTKPAEVVQEACQVLEEHGYPVKKLEILNELFTRHLLTAEECFEVARQETCWLEDDLAQVLLTKPSEELQEACHVMEKHGCPVKKELKMLSELYQEMLVTEDEVKALEEVEDLPNELISIQCTKPPEVVTRTADVLDTFGHNAEARKLRVVNELFARHLLTAEECSEVARDWEDHLTLVMATKPTDIVQKVNEVLMKGPKSALTDFLYHHELSPEPVLIESPDEVLLQQLCYLATGIQQFHIGPDGGTFTLGSGDASLEFPPGAVEKETAVHYAIILHGPFVFPAGCKPGSVVVYINMDRATLVKPVHVSLSHWCSRDKGDDNTVKFLRAPHALEAGKEYVFKELEEGYFPSHTNVGILTIPKPQCLYCVEMKVEEVARYNALTFQKCGESGSPLYFRIQLMCDSKEWNKTVESALHRNGWNSCSSGVAPFSFVAEETKLKITACPADDKGPGWISRIDGRQSVFEDEFLKLKNKSKEEFEGEVSSGRFPPYIHYKVLYTSPEERRPQPALMKVDLKGTNENLKLSCDIMEEVSPLPSVVPVSNAATCIARPPIPPAPDTAAIIKALKHQLDAKWRHFGTFLGVDYQLMEAIKTSNGGNPEDCMLDLLGKWTSNQAGTGTLPRTWQAVVNAVKEAGFEIISKSLALEHGVNLSQ